MRSSGFSNWKIVARQLSLLGPFAEKVNALLPPEACAGNGSPGRNSRRLPLNRSLFLRRSRSPTSASSTLTGCVTSPRASGSLEAVMISLLRMAWRTPCSALQLRSPAVHQGRYPRYVADLTTVQTTTEGIFRPPTSFYDIYRVQSVQTFLPFP